MNKPRPRKGAVGMMIGEITVGVVLLFVGVFMLAAVEPMFTSINTCSNTSATGTPEIQLNGTTNATDLQNFTIGTLVSGYTCHAVIEVENVSSTSGNVYVRVQGSATVLATIPDPTTTSTTTITGLSPTASSVYQLNFTHIGADDINITTNSYVNCCSSLVRSSTPAGQNYDSVVALIGTAFSVMGLLLIIIGLAAAIGSLRNMT